MNHQWIFAIKESHELMWQKHWKVDQRLKRLGLEPSFQWKLQ